MPRDDHEQEHVKKKNRPNKLSNYIPSVIFNFIFMFVINKVPDWNILFITEQFSAVLWALNLALAVQIAGNFMLIFYRPLFLHHLIHVIIALFSLLSLIILYTVYPFDFSFVGDWFDLVIKIILIAASIGTVISGIINLIKFFTSLAKIGKGE